MKSHIQKLNLYHSLIFFLIINIFSLIVDQSNSEVISPLICFLFILTIGISHGSLDHSKGKKLLNILNISNMFYFYILYLLIGTLVIILWLFLPSITLILFLIVASYHFGKEDTDFLKDNNIKSNQLFYFFKGILIIVAPLNFHFEETINIFKLLFVDSEKFYVFLGYVENLKIIPIIFLLSLISSMYLFFKNFKFINFSIFLDFFSILILNYYLTPLLAFTFYFCFLHSIRHSISLIFEIDKNNFKKWVLNIFEKSFTTNVNNCYFVYIIPIHIKKLLCFG